MAEQTFENFATEEGARLARYDRRREPSAEEHAERNRQIAQAWQREIERREHAATRRLASFRKALPLRAFEAMLVGERTPAIDAIAKWHEHTEREGGIAVLAGGVGVGKTVAATWWAFRFGCPPKFITAPDYARSSRYGEDRAQLLSASAIILDDLGSEYADAKGSFAVDLDELINAAYSNRAQLVITTNLTRDAFKVRYAERVADRVREAGTWIAIAGASMRGPARS